MQATGELIRLLNYVDDIAATMRRIHATLPTLTVEEKKRLAEYMRKLKTEKALSMIRFPENSLTSIAYACGFFDQSHFTRIFKQLNGILPSKYKNL